MIFNRSDGAIALRPLVERAFEQPKVSIDFAGFSGETLHGVIQEPLDKIRVGSSCPRALTSASWFRTPASPGHFLPS